MVEVKVGDLLSSNAQTLVNTVNTVGVMGKGIALEFRKRFPDMYKDYVKRCEQGLVRLGEPYLYRDRLHPWILNFPTKDHWRSVSKLSAIVRGLNYLKRHYREWGIQSLAVPPLGCGQGGLEWIVVGPTLYRHLSEFDIPVELYAPFGTPTSELDAGFLGRPPSDEIVSAGRLQPGLVALVETLRLIEAEPHGPMVGRTIMQKIAYFAGELGVPTGVEHEQASYGPFAPGLKQTLTRLVNNGLLEEQPIGRMIRLTVGPTFADARKAYSSALEEWRPKIDRLADLFLRIRNTDQAEIAASVHFAARKRASERNGAVTEQDVLDEVLHWKRRRRTPLDPHEVAKAIRGLGMLGWLSLVPSESLPIDEESLIGA